MAKEIQKIIDELIKRKEEIDITIKTLQIELGQATKEAPKKRGRKKGTTAKKAGKPAKRGRKPKAAKAAEAEATKTAAKAGKSGETTGK